MIEARREVLRRCARERGLREKRTLRDGRRWKRVRRSRGGEADEGGLWSKGGWRWGQTGAYLVIRGAGSGVREEECAERDAERRGVGD